VIEVLLEKTSYHPTAYPTHHVARKKLKSLSLSTVYSILNEFFRYGIVKMLEFDKMENRHEANTREHIKLICKGCKKIMDCKLPFRVDTSEAAKKRVPCHG
jgi:Fe2+ or Zn2+ uptake regulation protein